MSLPLTRKDLMIVNMGPREGKVAGTQGLQQEGPTEEFPSRQPGLEGDTPSHLSESEIWQMVIELGGTAPDRKDSTRQLLPGGVIGGTRVTPCYQWEISQAIPLERVAVCLSRTYGQYAYIALRT